jgi:hypothetical protein
MNYLLKLYGKAQFSKVDGKAPNCTFLSAILHRSLLYIAKPHECLFDVCQCHWHSRIKSGDRLMHTDTSERRGHDYNSH